MSESLFQDQSLLDNEEGGDAKKEGRMLSKCDERVEGKKKSCENAVSAEIPSEGLSKRIRMKMEIQRCANSLQRKRSS